MSKSEVTVPTSNPSGVPGSLRLAESARHPGGLFFRAARRDEDVIGHLSETDARALSAWLAERYPTPDATESAEAAPAPFERGTPLVVVTDDARGYMGTPADLPKGTPVVVAEVAVDPANGYAVKALRDGRLVCAWVRPGDVAPAMPEPVALAVGQVRELKPDARSAAGRGRAFVGCGVTRVRLAEDLGDGDWRVSAVDGKPTFVGLSQGVDPAYLGALVETPAADRP